MNAFVLLPKLIKFIRLFHYFFCHFSHNFIHLLPCLTNAKGQILPS